ncbi:MAG: TauD/TfdA family dioxygenase [Myxococcota bacterium]
MTALSIQPLPAVGAEVRGAQLAQGLDEAAFGRVRDAFAEHGLLFFRDQTLAETDHIAFAERFGKINVNRFFAAHPDHPQIALVAKEPEQKQNIGGGWHTDHSYDEEPALGSMLVARELPPEGGDTWFAGMYAAYDALSDELKETVEGLRAVHSAHHIFGTRADVYRGDARDRIGNASAADDLHDVTHPVVIRHPLSGRRALYVNPGFTIGIAGWEPEPAKELLGKLYRVATDARHVTRFRWEPGSVAFWDNRATWHWAQNDYHGHRRVMHRITIEGCALGA